MIKWLYIGAWNEERIYVWKKGRIQNAIKEALVKEMSRNDI